MKQSISVIIPTTASSLRTPLLWRALRSLLGDQDGLILPIVVFNGTSSSPDAVEALRQRRDIRCLWLDRASHVDARLLGRKAVDTEFFGLLDDDDEYLPGAAQLRLGALADNPASDAVITNGYQHENGVDILNPTEIATCQQDPLGSLMDTSWLHSAAGLFRSDQVPVSDLESPQSMELTYMALRLALTRTLLFLDVPTYRWHRGTPESLSATSDYVMGETEALRQMLALPVPPRIRKRLRQKYGASLHFRSDVEMRNGRYLAAWRYHLMSLGCRSGIRYLGYTRHLLRIPPR